MFALSYCHHSRPIGYILCVAPAHNRHAPSTAVVLLRTLSMYVCAYFCAGGDGGGPSYVWLCQKKVRPLRIIEGVQSSLNIASERTGEEYAEWYAICITVSGDILPFSAYLHSICIKLWVSVATERNQDIWLGLAYTPHSGGNCDC